MFYSINKTVSIYQSQKDQSFKSAKETLKKQTLKAGEVRGGHRGFNTPDLPSFGQTIGYMRKPAKPLVYTCFVTKGGVLKTSLTLNLARMAALHGLKTLVIGLDMQCDITTALGYSPHLESDDSSLDQALSHVDETLGLNDFFMKKAKLEDLILETDLPTLFFIPETPELVAMDQNLMQRSRREYWLKEKVIEPLKQQFDLIVIDCSPNWNQLITNALVATDVLVSPLECKINNYRNFRMFRAFVEEFKEEMQLSFIQHYIPTRFTPARKLSREIGQWYMTNVNGCIQIPIKDSTQGEEATAMHVSLPEYAPGSPAAMDMNQALKAVWQGSASVQQSEATSSYSSTKNDGMINTGAEI